MKTQSLPRLKSKNKKRLGRGAGSGKGKTSGRGTKGQNARNKLSVTHSHFEGGQRPLMKRLPYRRGEGNKPVSKKPVVVNLKAINILPKGEEVSINSLIKYKIVDEKEAKSKGVKILGDGNLERPYTFNVKTSKSAVAKIEKAGGKILTSTKK